MTTNPFTCVFSCTSGTQRGGAARIDRLCPRLLLALGRCSTPSLPGVSCLRISASGAIASPDELADSVLLSGIPISRDTHLCANTALCSSESLLSSWWEGIVMPRSCRCKSSSFCRTWRMCLAFSVSSMLASWYRRS